MRFLGAHVVHIPGRAGSCAHTPGPVAAGRLRPQIASKRPRQTAHGSLPRRLWADQHGQSLVIVSLAMVAVLGICAMAIDVSSWYIKHHQAQVVADSAALAAANCLANPGTGENTSTVPQCTSGTDVSDAQKVAVAYAADNGITISTSAVNVLTSSDQVTVTATTTAPAFFAKLFGIHSATETAGATAGWKATGQVPCTQSAQSQGLCYAIYAANTGCGSNNGWIASRTYENITGAIHSQGAMNIGGGTFVFNGPVTYNSGDCSYASGLGATMSGPYKPTAGDNQPANYWPLDYATVFPACGPTSTYQCTTVAGVSGVPSYCTDATTSASGFTFGQINGIEEPPTAGNVYCSVGSGNPSNPSTWNGPITFSQGGSIGSSSNPVAATYIGGYVSATNITMSLQPAPNTSNCLFYVMDTDANAGGNGSAILLHNGAYTFTGTMFAPNGTISLSSTSATAAFLEAQNVNTTSLSFTGDGPTVTTSGSSVTSGSDYLTQ